MEVHQPSEDTHRGKIDAHRPSKDAHRGKMDAHRPSKHPHRPSEDTIWPSRTLIGAKWAYLTINTRSTRLSLRPTHHQLPFAHETKPHPARPLEPAFHGLRVSPYQWPPDRSRADGFI